MRTIWHSDVALFDSSTLARTTNNGGSSSNLL
jgi:hypothetical protein